MARFGTIWKNSFDNQIVTRKCEFWHNLARLARIAPFFQNQNFILQ